MAIWPHIEIGPNSQNRVEAETLISGGGLLRLYRAICATDGTTPTLDSPEAVTHAGLDGREAAATEALDLFATYLGRLAGDVALIFMPFGGVFLGGGIAPRIAAVLQKGGFREAFVDKAPHRALLERMATAIVTLPEAALIGIAAFAQAPLRFGVDLRGRRWTD
jgi:glucokinase